MSPFRDSRLSGREALWLQRGRPSQAQVLVMFALMLPLLCAAAAISVDIALMVRNQAQLRAAAAAAARAGVSEIDIALFTAFDVITIDPVSEPTAKDAAMRICTAYRDALPTLTCKVDIVFPSSADATVDAGLAEYVAKSRDTTLRWGPGVTPPMAVRVTASNQVRLYFLPVVMRDGRHTLESKTQQSAIVVSGQ